MKRLIIVGVILSLSMTVQGENLIANSGFENGISSWVSWPKQLNVSTSSPAGGKNCLEFPKFATPEMLIQRPIAAKEGYSYRLTFKLRGDNFTGSIKVSVTISKGQKEPFTRMDIGNFKVYDNNWHEFECGFAVPSGLNSLELCFTRNANDDGTAFIDDVILAEAGAIVGKFGNTTVTYSNDLLTVRNENLEAKFNPKQNLSLTGLTDGNNLDKNSVKMIGLAIDSETLLHEYSSDNIYSSPVITEASGVVTLIINQNWPSGKVTKTYTFYEQNPYIHLNYELKVTRSFKARRIILYLRVADGLSNLIYPVGTNFSYKKAVASEKDDWFGMPRDNSRRFFAFADDTLNRGVAFIGADAEDWAELPPNILAVATTKGIYSFEISKVGKGKEEYREGDKVNFDFFILPLKDGKVEDKIIQTYQALTQNL